MFTLSRLLVECAEYYILMWFVYLLCCVLWAYMIDKLKIEKILVCARNRGEIGL